MQIEKLLRQKKSSFRSNLSKIGMSNTVGKSTFINTYRLIFIIVIKLNIITFKVEYTQLINSFLFKVN